MDAAQRYKAEADRLAASFYGPTGTPKPTQDSSVSSQDPSMKTANSGPRDPSTLRRFISAQSPSSPPPTDDIAVSETAIRDGVATVISRLGLSSQSTDDVDDSSSIHRAERDLHETVSNTGGADLIALAMSSSSTTELPPHHHQTPSSPPPASSSLKYSHHPAGVQPSSSSRPKTSSITVIQDSSTDRTDNHRSVQCTV